MGSLNKLPENVAKGFQLVGIADAAEINTPKGIVDLSKISLKEAKVLAKDPSFNYLEKKPTTAD
jgi:hypothetical protein